MESAIDLSAFPIVATSGGRYRGRSVDGVRSFKGIRYAVADRFMPPQRPEPHAGVADALAFGAIAPQADPAPAPGPPPVILAQLPKPPDAPPPPTECEDCLFLNVWTPRLGDEARLPVMVWLHGGFFYGGSGSGVDGSRLAARGAVVVSLNHRLNAFGFCHLADIAGPEFAHSGNAGMLDIIAALEWVRDNIAAFGGDPARVMVFGTSGGGMKTSFLMASPRGRPLVHRAGIQSGPGLRFMERDAATRAAEMLLAELGLKSRNAAALRTVEQKRLLGAYHAVARKLPPKRFIDLPCFAPVLDPELLPRHPFSPDAAPGTADIPMLTGWTAQEMTFFMGNDAEGFALDDAGLEARLGKLFGARAADARQLYRRDFPGASPSELYIQAFSDLSLMLPVLAQAERKAEAGGEGAYVYRLDLRSPALGGRLGAVHTIETPLIFDTADRSPLTAGAPGAAGLAARMADGWVRFAETGDPNGAGLPEWPRYAGMDRQVMILDETCRVAADPGAERRAMLLPLLDV